MTEEKTEETEEDDNDSGTSNETKKAGFEFESPSVLSVDEKQSLRRNVDDYDVQNNDQNQDDITRDQKLVFVSGSYPPKQINKDINIPIQSVIEYSNSVRDRNRCMITVFHFVITYPRWSISLFIFFAMMTYPLATYNEQVSRPLTNIDKLIEIESYLYYDCVVNGFHNLFNTMNRTIQMEVERINSTKIVNDIKIGEAEIKTSLCQDNINAVQRSLKVWNHMSNAPLPLRISDASSNDTCTTQDQDRLRDMIQETITNDEPSINELFNDYISQSLNSVQKLADYMKVRSDYDYNYFIGMKLTQISVITTNFSMPDSQLQFPLEAIANALNLILQDMVLIIKECYNRIDLMLARLAEFKISIDAFYQNYMDLYNRFDSISVFIRDFVPDSVTLPSFFDISGMPSAEMLMPPSFSIPDFDIYLPDIDLITSTAVQEILELLTTAIVDAAKDASDQTKEVVEQMIEKLKATLKLEDYNPPKYPISSANPEIQSPFDEISSLSTLSGNTKASADEMLKHIEDRKDSVPYETSTFPPLDIDKPSDLDSEGSSRFTMLETQFPDLSVPAWIAFLVAWICQRSIYIECIAQLIRLLRLKRKYERDAQPELPEINFIKKENKCEEEGSNSTTNNHFETIKLFFLRHLLNPWVILGAACIPLIICILILWFPHIKKSCIDSRNGTFVARHIITPILVNKANFRGHAAHSTSTMSCYHKRNSVCSEMLSETVAEYQHDVMSANSLISRFDFSVSNMAIIDRCIDTETLDNMFIKNCCGLQGYVRKNETCSIDQKPDYCPIDDTLSPPAPFRPVGEISMESGCGANLEVFLDDTTFNCNVLQGSCTFNTCKGVDEKFILQMTIDADCKAESYTIQFCLFIALVVYHAIVINIIVSFVFNGVKCIWWRRIRSDRIKMITHVNENGELMKGSDRHKLASRIAFMIKTYERLGRIQLVIGGFIFMLWILSFFALKRIASYLTMYHE